MSEDISTVTHLFAEMHPNYVRISRRQEDSLREAEGFRVAYTELKSLSEDLTECALNAAGREMTGRPASEVGVGDEILGMIVESTEDLHGMIQIYLEGATAIVCAPGRILRVTRSIQ